MILIFEFVTNLQTADQENEQRRRLELAALALSNKKEEEGEVVLRGKSHQKRHQVNSLYWNDSRVSLIFLQTCVIIAGCLDQ